jgi:hypothetical protein
VRQRKILVQKNTLLGERAELCLNRSIARLSILTCLKYFIAYRRVSHREIGVLEPYLAASYRQHSMSEVAQCNTHLDEAVEYTSRYNI